ncbi:MAG TPA: LysR substrate-binding domain-containing protein [Ramlibacter sp.]|nr:LysR substrate-binding domain-containing protein [Ramlibacter sp.]
MEHPPIRFQRRHLELLVAVADTGSMHKAAQLLRIAQPAVSRVLAELERAVGARLLERTAVGSVLTPRGQALVAQARAVLGGLERMEDLARQHAATVRFGCIPRAMHTLMPFLVEGLGDLCRLAVTEEGSPLLLAALQRGALDMAVMRHVGGAQAMEGGLRADRLYDERPVVICRPGRRFPRRKVQPLASLAGFEWVLPARETMTRSVLDRFWQDQALPHLRTVLETRSYESSAAIASPTGLLSIIPQSIARRYERAGLLQVVPVEPSLPGTAVLLVAGEHAAGDPVLQGLRERVREAAERARQAFALTP